MIQNDIEGNEGKHPFLKTKRYIFIKGPPRYKRPEKPITEEEFLRFCFRPFYKG
jgi:hypothetical protein